jgi:hypothetical protein
VTLEAAVSQLASASHGADWDALEVLYLRAARAAKARASAANVHRCMAQYVPPLTQRRLHRMCASMTVCGMLPHAGLLDRMRESVACWMVITQLQFVR